MGLDMYVNSITQKEWDDYIECVKKNLKFETKVKELWDTKWKAIIDGLNLPKDDEFGHYDVGKFTPEQNKVLEEYRLMYRNLRHECGLNDEDNACDGCENINELGYWRKCWALHNFIANLMNHEENDNCVRMRLTKDICKEIIDKVNGGCICSVGERDYWDDDDKEYTVNVFTNAMNAIDDGLVVYYYAWY